MNDAIAVLVLVTATGTLVIKAAGPCLFGNTQLKPTQQAFIDLAAPALLAALIAVLVFARNSELVIDERLAGIIIGGAAISVKANILLVALLSGVTTALLRAWLSG